MYRQSNLKRTLNEQYNQEYTGTDKEVEDVPDTLIKTIIITSYDRSTMYDTLNPKP